MVVLTAFSALSALAGVALADPGVDRQKRHGDQQEAFEARRDGRIMPLREIERRVVPGMKDAQYIGFVFDSGSGIYTLKFLRDGTVIWVDVDGRSGHIIGRTDK